MNSIALSPDGTRVASGSYDGMICLWDTFNGALVASSFIGHRDPAICVTFSPDGARIASGSRSGILHMWGVLTGPLLVKLFEVPDIFVQSITFSPDGNQFAAVCRGEVQIWDSHRGEAIGQAFGSPEGSVKSVAYSPDGTRLTSGSEPHASLTSSSRHGHLRESLVHMWEINHTGDSSSSRLWKSKLPTGSINCVAFSSDGALIAAGSFYICVLDANDGRLHNTLTRHFCRVSSIAFSPDGSRIVAGFEAGMLYVWDLRSGAIVAGPFNGHTSWEMPVAFSPDGSRILSSSVDCMVRFWDLAAATKPDAMYNHSPFIGEDGWLTGPKSQRLLWVPSDLREHFRFPTLANPSIITSKCSSFIDNSTLYMGDQWHNCYRPSS